MKKKSGKKVLLDPGIEPKVKARRTLQRPEEEIPPLPRPWNASFTLDDSVKVVAPPRGTPFYSRRHWRMNENSTGPNGELDLVYFPLRDPDTYALPRSEKIKRGFISVPGDIFTFLGAVMDEKHKVWYNFLLPEGKVGRLLEFFFHGDNFFSGEEEEEHGDDPPAEGV